MSSAPPTNAATALSQLTHNRWALPVLEQVARDGGCKLVTLSRRLNAPPASLRRALQRLADLDLVVRNPGYGHPLRPEYILGATGELTEGLPQQILRWSSGLEGADELLKKWQLPVLVALGPEVTRFGEVKSHLTGATSRAVALALKSHAALGLVHREVEGGYPPSPLYTPTQRALHGREPARALGQILSAR